MKAKKSIWYYISIVGIAFSVGAITYGIVTGEYIVIARLLLVLGLSVYFFIRERKGKEEVSPK